MGPTMGTTPAQQKQKTYVYIDGFNLYYGALKKRGVQGLKWLNVELLCKNYLKNHDILKIKYFTASVSGKYDPSKPLKQELYARALRTLPSVEIILGTFSYNKKSIQITAESSFTGIMPEEKGSDVNIGAHLINDAHLKKFDTAIIVSNDSDLAEVVRIATQELKVKVGLLNPYGKFQKRLQKYATPSELYSIREGAVSASQFPISLADSRGTIQKPATW
jgi:uncharacterized LabA/DUF88 family protein